jgi:hypothetical protein
MLYRFCVTDSDIIQRSQQLFQTNNESQSLLQKSICHLRPELLGIFTRFPFAFFLSLVLYLSIYLCLSLSLSLSLRSYRTTKSLKHQPTLWSY